MRLNIIGAGGWGTALATILSANGLEPTLWVRERETADTINNTHENSAFLPGVTLSKSIRVVNDLAAAAGAPVLVLAVPTQYIRETVKKNVALFEGKIIINVAKGIERGTGLRVSQILREAAGITPENYVVLTGPSHAEEVARNTPTAVVAASENQEAVKIAQEAFSTASFRVYSGDDVIGAEIGGAVKNIIAIAAGIIDGLEIGDNAKAALITRGLAEMSRLGAALGADVRTFAGLSGLGDLIVTCDSRHSRNRRVGEEIGRGKQLPAILSEMRSVAEGVWTTESVLALADSLGVEMPIAAQVGDILFRNKSPRAAIIELMTRETRSEN
ncbi:MAG: NAD(P)-dependent glycerol-3-phosphate dehydrogenase [Bacteroidetes bacterium]|nr:NAD(P)-dependent glycerol-3-phosphate dehydrogenase [Bacteroidota bacterium]MCZ2131864.1 NAD(P)-dependent glycerol-3-phosphate dehydrogenase [Bacteroidota bacterium]